jgi:putative membrane protein
VFSILWALVRLHGYSLVQVGEDLRSEYGLLTRVTATVPRRRIQSITIRDTPLHRLLGRASVSVATAGGVAAEGERAPQHREWLAPIIRRDQIPVLLGTLLPGVDIAGLDWQPPHQRAFRRVLVRTLVTFAVLIGLAVLAAGLAALWLAPIALVFGVYRSRRYVRLLGWAMTDAVAASRRGAFVQRVSVAPLARIQVVERFESPFDRRTAMRRVHADIAGGGGLSMPYLAAATADQLYGRLCDSVAATAFKW